MPLRYKSIEFIEKHAGVLGVLIAIMISLGGLAEIVPLLAQAHQLEAPPGVKPYDALRLAGKDIYVREGCYLCHSQMIRTLRFETQRYGDYSVANDSYYDRPFQWGSKRTGPDLARVGGKYSDAWQRLHLINPQTLVPESNMPNYRRLEYQLVDGEDMQARMRALRRLGDPYSDAEIADAAAAVKGKSELDALVAYLQGLGISNEVAPPNASTPTSATATSNAVVTP